MHLERGSHVGFFFFVLTSQITVFERRIHTMFARSIWFVLGFCTVLLFACAENRALAPRSAPIDSRTAPAHTPPTCECDAGVDASAASTPGAVPEELPAPNASAPEFWRSLGEPEFAPYRTLAINTFQMPDQPPAEVKCVRVTEADVMCRSDDFVSGITHHMGGPYFARMIGMHRGRNKLWIDVPISVSAHFSMARASPTFVQLEVQIAEGGRFRLIQSLGSCKGHGAKWGDWSDWRVVARKACDAEGVYEVKNGVLRALPWTTALEIVDTDAPRETRGGFN